MSGAAGQGARGHTLLRHPEPLAVVRMPAGSEVPDWAESSSLLSVTATAAETSIVCAASGVPRKTRHEAPYTAFQVEGPLDLALTGVLAALLAPLAEAGLGVFAISTFDTDWLLVPGGDAEAAADAWRANGHTVTEAAPAPPEESAR